VCGCILAALSDSFVGVLYVDPKWTRWHGTCASPAAAMLMMVLLACSSYVQTHAVAVSCDVDHLHCIQEAPLQQY